MPLAWREVKKGLDPRRFTLQTVFPRLSRTGDLFEGVVGKAVDLRTADRKLRGMMEGT
jgi:DNA primase